MVEVVQVRVPDLDVPPGLPPGLGDGDGLLAPHVLGGQGRPALEERVHRPGEDDLAARLARPRAEVDDAVGGPDDLGIVLDHDDGVPDVLERLEDPDEPLVVPGVEADAGLVEDEQRPDEGRAQGRGQVDPLGLAPGQGERHPVEGDVVEADLEQEPEAVPDLGDELLGDLALERGEVEGREEIGGLADGHPDELADPDAADADAQGPGVEPRLAAGRAGDVLAVAGEEHPDLDLVLLGLEPFEEALDPVIAVAAVQDEAPGLGREVPERDVRRDAPLPGLGEHLALEAAREGFGPGLDGPLLERQAPVGDDLVLVEDGHVAEPVALRAGALGAVEREQVREGVLVGDAAFLAFELVGDGDAPGRPRSGPWPGRRPS